jgi:hypothetical protein
VPATTASGVRSIGTAASVTGLIPHPRIDDPVGDIDQQIEHQDDH